MTASLVRIGFGGGCHWCTEAVFQALAGVETVEQGFIRSDPPYEDWSEAVRITFDPERIPLAVLIEVHLRTHASTSAHKLRGKYRSAIYTEGADQASEAERALALAAATIEGHPITRILPNRAFKPSDARFRNYYRTDPERPFCQTYIDPKLRLLRERFAGRLG